MFNIIYYTPNYRGAKRVDILLLWNFSLLDNHTVYIMSLDSCTAWTNYSEEVGWSLVFNPVWHYVRKYSLQSLWEWRAEGHDPEVHQCLMQCCQLSDFVAISGDFPDPLGDFISKKATSDKSSDFFLSLLLDYCVDKALKKHLTYPVLQFTLQPISWELSTVRVSSSPLHSHSACVASLTR